MRTAIAVIAGIIVCIAGMWWVGSDQGARSQGVSSAWAEMAPAGGQDKPWTAPELEEIAKFYEVSADTVEDEALQYERTAASITPLTDTKGFRRSALTIAAQSKWKQAAELRHLAAEHREKAQRMYAKERAN